jgi:hypothetical protein
MGLFPEYTPGLTVTGSVTVTFPSPTSTAVSLNLAGLPADYEGHIHIHEGTSCDTVVGIGGHYYDAANIDPDPWDDVHYMTDANGVTTSSFTLTTGYDTLPENQGHVVVIHANMAKVSCGVLLLPTSAPSKSPTSSPTSAPTSKPTSASNACGVCPANGWMQLSKENCLGYVECQDGDIIRETDCPAGQYYNPTIKGCNIATQVTSCACGGLPATTTVAPGSGSTAATPFSNTCGTSDPANNWEQISKENCSGYYSIANGKVLSDITCPAGQLYNPAIQGCNIAAQVTSCACGGLPATTTTTVAPGGSTGAASAPGVCGVCPASSWTMLATDGCTGYHHCVDGVLQEYHKCESGLFFNLATRACDIPSRVTCNCGTAAFPTTTTTTTTGTGATTTAAVTTTTTATSTYPAGSCGTCPASGGHITGSGCAGYYTCTDGKPNAYVACPAGQLWNQAGTRCDWVNQAPACTCP